MLLPDFQNPTSGLSSLPPERADFNYDRSAPIDIPLDSAAVGTSLQILVYSGVVFLRMQSFISLMEIFQNLGFEKEREGAAS